MKCPYCGHEHKKAICPKCFAKMPDKKKTKSKEPSKEE